MPHTHAHTDVLLIGAGPIGIELAVALKQARVDYLHFDARQVGYTISWFPPQTRFFSSNDRIAIAGVPLQTPDQNKSTREQYLAYLRTVVQLFDLPIHTYEPITHIERRGGDASRDGFLVTTGPASGPRTFAAQRIVLATGGTAHPRKLNVPGEDLPHVCSRLDDPHVYFRQRLLVVGGKNSAIETALRCHHAGARVSLSYRRAALDPKHVKYWLYPEINGLLKSGEIRGHLPTHVTRINPSAVTLRHPDGTEEDVPTDFVLLSIGYEADMSLCRLAGVHLTGPCDAPVYNEATMETNVPNVYLAGTVTGGTQDKYAVFLENGHVHTPRILAALTGSTAPAANVPVDVLLQPES